MSSSLEADFRAAQLSIIIPCYNEARNIVPLVSEIKSFFSKEAPSLRWEIIFVDDNSPDKTSKIILQEAKEDRRIRCIRRIGRRGLSSAVIEGMLSSSSAIIAVMDGDLQHNPASLLKMFFHITEENADLVVASRYKKGGSNRGLSNKWRHFISYLSTNIVQKILSIALTDPMSGFFMLKREIVDMHAGELHGKGFKILLDIIAVNLLAQKKGARAIKIEEVPIIFRERFFGESKLDYKVIFYFLLFIIVMIKKKLIR